MRQVLSTALTALVVAALTAVTVSALAQDAPAAERTVAPAAVSKINADRVDGKHAIGYTTKRLSRRNKLVATNKQGYLPSNIVKPFWGNVLNKPAPFADGQISWNEIAGIPADFADGVDDAGGGYVTSTHACPIVDGDYGAYVSFMYLPRGVVYDFQVVPTSTGNWVYIDRQEVQENADGTLNIDLLIQTVFSSDASCNVRMVSFPDSISLASTDRRLDAMKVVQRGPNYKRQAGR